MNQFPPASRHAVVILAFAAALMLVNPLTARSASVNKAGADVPFTTLEAESGQTTGQIVRMAHPPKKNERSPAIEASGRAFVQLNDVGDSITFHNVPAANTMVIRNCIPDAPTGGGITASLTLYVNGQRRQAIQLSSKYNWLYGEGKPGQNGQGNKPTQFPHRFWDEARFFIQGGVKAGDTIRLQKDSGDRAAYYRIDLIELEQVAGPRSRPTNSLSVTDYGAGGKDAATDTQAILKCIADAKAQGKIVWLPPGTYLQDQPFVLDGVKLQGAGMWYTSVLDTVGSAAPKWGGEGGFKLAGDGSSVSDIYVRSTRCTTRQGHGPIIFRGFANHWSVKRVWIAHTAVGFWMAGTNGVISHCRVRDTYADGININNGTSLKAENILVENNHVRGTGDDGIAVLASAHSPHGTQRVTIRHNTVSCAWWGADCDLAGGSRIVIEDNRFADGVSEGLGLNMPSAYPMRPLNGAIIRGNTLLRCGGNYSGQRRGAIWVYPNTGSITKTTIEDNQIIDPLFRGIHLHPAKFPSTITFKNNLIDHPGRSAIYIAHGATGKGTFIHNTARRLNQKFQAVENQSEQYQSRQKGNSWQ